MIRSLLFISTAVFILGSAYSQTTQENVLDVGLAVGSRQGSMAASYVHNWRLGNKNRFTIGVGGRVTSYLGANQDYITAPAKLTSGKQGLLVIFTENIEANLDTVLMKTAQVNAINAMINLGYQFSDKLSFAFNIDFIGASFGTHQRGNYMMSTSGQNLRAHPSGFNLLLTSDNDLGTLNSEFALRYRLNEMLTLRAGLQFLFTEYITETKVQQVPEPNDRFRNKSSMLSLGVVYQIRRKS